MDSNIKPFQDVQQGYKVGQAAEGIQRPMKWRMPLHIVQMDNKLSFSKFLQFHYIVNKTPNPQPHQIRIFT